MVLDSSLGGSTDLVSGVRVCVTYSIGYRFVIAWLQTVANLPVVCLISNFNISLADVRPHLCHSAMQESTQYK